MTYEQRWGHPRTRKATHPERELKRAEAKQRNAEWAATPYTLKLRSLYMRPGKCARQLARLKHGELA